MDILFSSYYTANTKYSFPVYQRTVVHGFLHAVLSINNRFVKEKITLENFGADYNLKDKENTESLYKM